YCETTMKIERVRERTLRAASARRQITKVSGSQQGNVSVLPRLFCPGASGQEQNQWQRSTAVRWYEGCCIVLRLQRPVARLSRRRNSQRLFHLQGTRLDLPKRTTFWTRRGSPIRMTSSRWTTFPSFRSMLRRRSIGAVVVAAG